MPNPQISKELSESPGPHSPRPWLIASIASLAILGIALGLMRFSGLLHVPNSEDETGAKILAAALALVGSVLAAAITLIGTVLKYSIDERTIRLAEVEAARNNALKSEAENRNRIEAAIRAVGLLGYNNQNSTAHQIGGALLALVSLEEHDLAVSLLHDLWQSNLASVFVAREVLRKALDTDSENTQTAAAAVLLQHADSIEQTGFHIWPLPTLRWRKDLPSNCRLGLIQAAAIWMKSELAKHESHLPDSAVVLHEALGDPDDLVKDVAWACLEPLSQAFPSEAYVSSGDADVSIAKIKKRLAESQRSQRTNLGLRFESDIRDVLSTGSRKI